MRVNGDGGSPCSETEGLEFHEMWGENHDGHRSKFSERVLLCSLHHALIEGRAHQAEFILNQYRPSRLQEDVNLEMLLEGGYRNWVKRWKLDDSRSGRMLFLGPVVDDDDCDREI